MTREESTVPYEADNRTIKLITIYVILSFYFFKQNKGRMKTLQAHHLLTFHDSPGCLPAAFYHFLKHPFLGCLCLYYSLPPPAGKLW